MHIATPYILFKFYRLSTVQNRFNQTFWTDFFTHNEKKLISKRNWRRINAYPFQFIVFFAEWFCQLKGIKLTEDIRERITLYAGGLCLYDDFFDFNTLSEEELKNIYLQPDSYKLNTPSKTNEEQIFLNIHTEFLNSYSPTEEFNTVFEKFYASQWESKAQLTQHLSEKILHEISYNKGGYALVLSYLLFEENYNAVEIDFVYTMGAWFQILDDVLDIASDFENSIQTIATGAKDIASIKHILKNKTEELYHKLALLPYSESNKAYFKNALRVIGASGNVHLHRITILEKKHKKHFLQLPIDVLKWNEKDVGNLWLALRYV